MQLRLRELRTERKLTQVQLASMIGSNQQSITDWETGKKIPYAEMLIAIADCFGISVDYLVGRTDVPFMVKSYKETDGEIICFTTEKPSGQETEELNADCAAFSVQDDSVGKLNRSELEQLVESLVRKALSELSHQEKQD